jgi:hypothetical protein
MSRFGIPQAAGNVIFFVAGAIGGVIAYWIIERPLLALFHRNRRFRHGAPIPGGV